MINNKFNKNRRRPRLKRRRLLRGKQLSFRGLRISSRGPVKRRGIKGWYGRRWLEIIRIWKAKMRKRKRRVLQRKLLFRMLLRVKLMKSRVRIK